MVRISGSGLGVDRRQRCAEQGRVGAEDEADPAVLVALGHQVERVRKRDDDRRFGPQHAVHLTEDPLEVPHTRERIHREGDIDLIAQFKDAGVVPNARVSAQLNPVGGVTIVIPGHENVDLPHEMAHAVRVEKV